MPASPIVLSLLFLGLAACAFALIKGGRAERVAALLILANTILGFLEGRFLPVAVKSVFLLVDDAIIAVAFLGLTLFYGSPWLGGVMLFYAAQFTLHSVYFVTDRPHDALHSIANNLDFLGIHLCLVLGTAIAWRRGSRRRETS